jgi:predicted nuclease with TOPRIM domain
LKSVSLVGRELCRRHVNSERKLVGQFERIKLAVISCHSAIEAAAMPSSLARD